jgi:SNF2 family DNA or RNA helicase
MQGVFGSKRLFGYQAKGVEWMIKRENAEVGPKGGFLCDEMGLGKTLQTITTIANHNVGRTLILCPVSLVGQWFVEFEKFTNITASIFQGSGRQLKTTDVVIAPYSVVAASKGVLGQVKWGRLVLDEGHQIRNKQTQVHQACVELPAKIRWILSGTPCFNGKASNILAMCDFLGLDTNNIAAVRNTYMLRRTKASVGAECPRFNLPPCEVRVELIQMDAPLVDVYSELYDQIRGIVRDIMDTDANAVGHNQMFILSMLSKLRSLCCYPQTYYNGIAPPQIWGQGSPKIDRLVELVKTHPKEKAIVFVAFTAELMEICRRLAETGRAVFHLNGSVTGTERAEQIENFEKAAPDSVLVINVQTGGSGLNLQMATRVYLMSPAWNPATELQAIARSYRTGQTQVVHVVRMVYEGTVTLPSIEETILLLQKRKTDVTSALMNDPNVDDVISKTTRVNIRAVDIKTFFRLSSGAA